MNKITKKVSINVGNGTKPQIILRAWHNYCMQSRLFRIMVRLGLRK